MWQRILDRLTSSRVWAMTGGYVAAWQRLDGWPLACALMFVSLVYVMSECFKWWVGTRGQ